MAFSCHSDRLEPEILGPRPQLLNRARRDRFYYPYSGPNYAVLPDEDRVEQRDGESTEDFERRVENMVED